MLPSLRATYAGVRRATTECDQCLSTKRIAFGVVHTLHERARLRTKSALRRVPLLRFISQAEPIDPGRARRRIDSSAIQDAGSSSPVSAAPRFVNDPAAM